MPARVQTKSVSGRAATKGNDRKKSTTSTRPTLKRSAKNSRRSDVEPEPTPSDHDSNYQSDAEEEATQSLDSDALDDDDDDEEDTKPKTKRKRGAASDKRKTPASRNPRKKRKVPVDEEEFAEEVELEEGQEVVGRVVQAPKTGRVPPGQISQNTLDFLNQLKKPECNDREWFKLHEPVYRLAEKEFKDFVEKFTDLLSEEDPQVPPLPPKDVIHRIYRDVRFSNDKTPYKTGLSATFSRSGRKGIFAKYHVSIRPGASLIAAGAWCPGKNELATIRSHIQRSPSRLRRVITNPEFERFFGKGKPHPKGEQQNIFGGEDELKFAPKGVDKGHKDIDLLKCRSFAVVHRFTDSEVLSSDFQQSLCEVVRVMRPFVYCLNDMMTLPAGDESDGSEHGEDLDETGSNDGGEAGIDESDTNLEGSDDI